MNRTAMVLFLSWTVPTVIAARADESVEPSVQYVLTLGNQAVELTENQERTLQGVFTNPKITLRAGNVRHFPYGGVEFDYPKHMSWEADVANRDSMTWTLDGNHAVIVFFLTTSELTPEAWGVAMVEQFGKESCKISPLTHTMGGKRFDGRKLVVTVSGATMVIRGIALPPYQGKQRLLVLQDTLTDEGAPSDEFQIVSSTLEKTFKVK